MPRDGQPPTTSLRDSIAFTYVIDSLKIGDTVAAVPGRAALGTLEVDSIRLSDVAWQTASNTPLSIVTEVVNGELVIDELCRTGGRVRLFDPRSEAQPVVQKVYDLIGRERDELQPGWNVIVTRQGNHVEVTRKFVEP